MRKRPQLKGVSSDGNDGTRPGRTQAQRKFITALQNTINVSATPDS